VFIPRDQLRAGALPGRLRVAMYALCKRCHRRPDARLRVERLFLADLAAIAERN
jgi:hypothetical protein